MYFGGRTEMVVKMVVRPIAKLSEGALQRIERPSTILGSNKAAGAVPRRCIEGESEA
jgi:hypothetical protein